VYEEVISYSWRKYDNGSGNIYVSRCETVEGKKIKIYLHRQITGAKKDEFVDHKNGDSLVNSRENLRLTDHRGNSRNRGKNKKYRNRNTSSRFKGVTWDRSRSQWKACINVDGRHIN
jgi:AP2-like factor, euAP2 lineage